MYPQSRNPITMTLFFPGQALMDALVGDVIFLAALIPV